MITRGPGGSLVFDVQAAALRDIAGNWVAAIPISGSQGGDAGAIVADFVSEAFQDIGTNKLDEIRDENFLETFPELAPHYNRTDLDVGEQ